MIKKLFRSAVFMLSLSAAFSVPLMSFAVDEKASMFVSGKPGIPFFYAVTAIVSLLLVMVYALFFKKKEPWIMLLHISVFIVNSGYFALSVSGSLGEALLANRISYLGSVFLPLCMLMTVIEACKLRAGRCLTGALILVSVAVFIIAASPGYLDIYYKEVSFEIVNGAATLVKVYGKLHAVYYIYLFAYFLSMLSVIVFAFVKKKIESYKHACVLLSVVFLNILIWLLEQLFNADFEFLSVSYIASETVILFFFAMMNDYKRLQAELKSACEQSSAVETTDLPEFETAAVPDEASMQQLISDWKEEYRLTEREQEILALILADTKRKQIAEMLCLSENTVKTHFAHIFAKIGVSGKSELIDKATEIMCQ